MRQCTLISPTWAKSLTKLNPKKQNFERALDLNCKQGCGSSQIFNASASSSSWSSMLPSSLPLPHLWNFLLPLPAPDRISRFRFRSLLSKCFRFHKNLTASCLRFHIPAQYETANWDFAWARSSLVFVREFGRWRLICSKLATIKPRKLKLGLNMKINECVMCASFGDPRSRDRELTRKRT